MKGLLPTTQEFIKKNKSTILTVIGTAGFVSTIIFTVKATKQASEIVKKEKIEEPKEIVYATWKCYVPVALTGSATLACFWGANVFNRKTQASLASAYALVDNSYKEYVNKLKDLYGEDTHNEIVDAIMKDHCDDVFISCPGMLTSSTIDVETEEPEVTRTFFDAYSKRYFDSTLFKVLQAEYHFNRNYAMGRYGYLNEFYEFLGLKPIDGGDKLGWSVYDGELYWIDFNHRVVHLNDDMEVIVIEFPFEPDIDTEEYY